MGVERGDVGGWGTCTEGGDVDVGDICAERGDTGGCGMCTECGVVDVGDTCAESRDAKDGDTRAKGGDTDSAETAVL